MNKDIYLKDEYRATTKSMSFLKANLLAVLYPAPLAAVYIVLFMLAMANRLSGNGESFSFTLNLMDIFLWILSYFAAFFGLVALHEFIHALFFLKGCDYGWKSIVFGFKSLTPYCHCSEVVSMNIYRQSLLAPLWAVCVPLAAASMITGSMPLFILTISMIFGSGGDLAIFWMGRKYAGKTTYVWDMEDAVGCIIYERISPAPESET